MRFPAFAALVTCYILLNVFKLSVSELLNFFPDIIIVMPLLCLLLLLSSGVWVTQAHLAPAVPVDEGPPQAGDCDTDTTLHGDKLMLHVLQMNITSQYNKASEIRILSNISTVDHFNSIITVSLSE